MQISFRRLAGWGLAGCTALWAQNPVPSTALAPAWSDLFRRTEGWTGGDGIFAIPLSGHEGPDHAVGNKTLFVFSDTFIGSVDSAGKRVNSTMVNNSLAILDGAVPDPERIRFFWGRNAEGKAASAFVPNTPRTAGSQSWYWLQDGFVHKGFVYDLPLIVTRDTAGPEGFQFKETGIALLKIPLGPNGEPDLALAVQKDTPLFFSGAGRTLYYGCGIMPNTAEAGAPDPDGYIYVYGRNSLYVARVRADDFEDFQEWRYWDGAAWSGDISKSASLGTGGPELSVTPIAQGSLKGKYLLVSSGLEPDIFIRVGESPKGPFGNRINVFKAPEWDAAGKIYTYNAKAHPSLSSDGNWLVTYNVNTPSFAATVARADIYRPRFFTLRLDPGPIPILRATGTGVRLHPGGFRFSGRGVPVFPGPEESGSDRVGSDRVRTLGVDGKSRRLLLR